MSSNHGRWYHRLSSIFSFSPLFLDELEKDTRKYHRKQQEDNRSPNWRIVTGSNEVSYNQDSGPIYGSKGGKQHQCAECWRLGKASNKRLILRLHERPVLLFIQNIML